MEEQKENGFLKALPFYLVFLNIPLVMWAIEQNGWYILIGYLYFEMLFSLGDRVFGINRENLDPLTQERQLFWYTLVTKLWPLAQASLIIFALFKLRDHAAYSLFERIAIMGLVGLSSGVAGIVIAHELIHQRNRLERTLGDILLGTVNYGHFRTEHVMGHHRYVATPRDPATSRYNESIYRFWLRVIPASFISAWRIEKDLLKRKNRPFWHYRNPFYIYAALSLVWVVIAFAIDGLSGIWLFFLQAFVAILLLETTNYIEHYGLVRMSLGEGKYEPVMPRHSWNANNRVTNYLMINLQRHSDHHYKPSRRYPLLQAYDETDAPQLPFGYITMSMIAMSPYHWRKLMNPRVRRWRSMYYPQITDWSAYNKGTTPWPK